MKTNESHLLPDAVTRHTEILLNAKIALKMKLNRKYYKKHFILYCNLHKRVNSITYKYRLHFTTLNINDMIAFLFNKLDGLYFHEIWPFYLSCLSAKRIGASLKLALTSVDIYYRHVSLQLLLNFTVINFKAVKLATVNH